MRINRLIDEFASRDIEFVPMEMISGGPQLVKWENHWFVLSNSCDPIEKQQLDLAHLLVFADHRAELPPEKFLADENTAQFLRNIKGDPKNFTEDSESKFAAQARLLAGK